MVFHVVDGSRIIGTFTDILRATVFAERTGAELWQSRKVRRLLPATPAKQVTPWMASHELIKKTAKIKVTAK